MDLGEYGFRFSLHAQVGMQREGARRMWLLVDTDDDAPFTFESVGGCRTDHPCRTGDDAHLAVESGESHTIADSGRVRVIGVHFVTCVSFGMRPTLTLGSRRIEGWIADLKVSQCAG